MPWRVSCPAIAISVGHSHQPMLRSNFSGGDQPSRLLCRRNWVRAHHSSDPAVIPFPFPSQFMDSMQLDPETVDNLDAYNHIPPQLMEKCAALSVRPDTVKNLVQSMQGEQSTNRQLPG